MWWEKQTRAKVHQGLLINYYRKQKKTNNKNTCCVFFSPSTFTVLQSLETGLAHFPPGSSKQKYIYMHSIPHPRQAQETYRLHVGARHAADVAGMHLTCCAAPCRARSCSRQRAVSLQHAARGLLVPAKLLQSRSWNYYFFFSFPRTNPVSDRGHAPGSWFSKALEVQDWLASSTSEVHWNQQVYSWLKAFAGDKQMSHFLPLPPRSGRYKARFLMSTETVPKHPMFSLPDH